jgi:hypothetical protein
MDYKYRQRECSFSQIFSRSGILVKHIKNTQPINFGVSDKEVAITIEQMEGGKLSRCFLISNDPVYTIRLNSVFEEQYPIVFRKVQDLVSRCSRIVDMLFLCLI